MPRVVKGAARHQSKKRLFKAVRGYRGPRSKNLRLAKEALVRGLTNALRGRRQKKRQYRSLWVIRLSAACKQRGIRYSQFIYGMKVAQIAINRKMLSEMVIHDPEGFEKVFDIVRSKVETAA